MHRPARFAPHCWTTLWIAAAACAEPSPGFGDPDDHPASTPVPTGQLPYVSLDYWPDPKPETMAFVDTTGDITASLGSQSGTFEELRDAEDSVEISTVGGLVVADLDADGALDIVATDRNGPLIFLLGDGRGGFEPATDRGLPSAGPRWSGVVAADPDGDADLDLLLFGLDDVLYENDGSGSFAVSAAALPSDGAGLTVGVSWADPDRDGDLDAYYANNGYGAEEDPPGPPDPDAFMVQVGPRTFENRIDNLVAATKDGYGFLGGWFDADLDGWLDFYLVQTADPNDQAGEYQVSNYFVWNRGSGGPVRYVAAPEVGLNVTMFGMGLGIGDLDDDGDFDAYVSDAGPSFLARNDGEDGFVDESLELDGLIGPETAEMGWSALLPDVDNDGHLDIYTAFGAQPNKIGSAANDTENHLFQPDMLFTRQNGEGAWVDVAADLGLDDPGMNRTAVFADLDRDGDLDVVTWQLVRGLRVLLNGGNPGSWLLVEPRLAEGGNRFAIGTRIEAWFQGAIVAMGAVDCGSTGLSSSGPPEVHLGLGPLPKVDLRIIWPDGEETWTREVPTNQRIRLTR